MISSDKNKINEKTTNIAENKAHRRGVGKAKALIAAALSVWMTTTAIFPAFADTESSKGETFSIEGLVIALIIAVAVILLVILLVPSGKGKGR